MTLQEAKKKLPGFARGLAEGANTVQELRNRVYTEFQMYQHGENPLTKDQVEQLRTFLAKTR